MAPTNAARSARDFQPWWCAARRAGAAPRAGPYECGSTALPQRRQDVRGEDRAGAVGGLHHDRQRLVRLAVGPDTPLRAVFPHLESLDRVVVMSVFPGWGGPGMSPG